MRVIVSPAKKMKRDTDSFAVGQLPHFLPQAEMLLAQLRAMEFEEIKALWKCSDAIAKKMHETLHQVDLRKGLTPAILAYEGIQYKYMAPEVFSKEEVAYVQQHVRILSGFYGVVRPLDGVVPYRLEMQAGLGVSGGRSLYEFWGSRLAEQLAAETNLVINLASQEYSKAVEAHLPEKLRFVSLVFGERQSGKIIEKGTFCKMARGEMVRFMAETQAAGLEDIARFDRLGYCFSPQDSDEKTLIFSKG